MHDTIKKEHSVLPPIIRNYLAKAIPDLHDADIEEVGGQLLQYITPAGIKLLNHNALVFIVKEYLERKKSPIETIFIPLIAMTNVADDNMQRRYGEELLAAVHFNRSSTDTEIRARTLH